MAETADVRQLIVVQAFKKRFKTGSSGFFGKAVDERGKRYQITAVEIGSKKGAEDGQEA
jgi:hypothetical protein